MQPALNHDYLKNYVTTGQLNVDIKMLSENMPAQPENTSIITTIHHFQDLTAILLPIQDYKTIKPHKSHSMAPYSANKGMTPNSDKIQGITVMSSDLQQVQSFLYILIFRQ